MSTAFSDLIAETTEAGIYALFQAAGSLVGLDYEAMPPNSVVRTIVKSVLAPVINAVIAPVIVTMARGGYLDFAPDGPWLEALGEQEFNTPRIRLTFATTTVHFTNTSDNVYSFAPGQVIVQNSASRKTYRAASFSLAESGAPGDEADVDIVAIEGGTDSNADTGQITIVTTAQDGLTVTNASPAIGTDLEPRAQYIARCRAAASATSPAGARLAYEYIATSAVDDDGQSLGVTKVQVVDNLSAGTVHAYLADADGPVTSDVADAVEAKFLTEVVPHGVNFTGADPAVAVTTNVSYTALALQSVGLSREEIEALVAADLEDLFADRDLNPIGGVNNNGTSGFLYASKIRSTIEQVQAEPGAPRPMVDVTLILPSSNVTPTNGQIAVLGTIAHGITMI